MNLRITVSLLFVGATLILQAQQMSIQNLNITEEGMVSFTCMISPDHSNREVYALEVFSSADNYSKPLGLNLKSIKAGSPMDVSFDAKQAVGNYKGTLQFKFVATATLFPVEVTISDSKFKRGKEMTVRWDDFHESGWYDVEMYKDGLLFKKLVGNHRGNSYTSVLPKKMPKGEYEVRVFPTNRQELVSQDMPVTVKGGKGGLVVVGILGAGGGAAAVLLGGGGGDPNGNTGGTDGTSLPDPPIPGN